MTTREDYRIDSATKSVSEILHQGRFEVPWHQREYDWDREHVERFWNDILLAQQREANDYFVGSIVLTRHSNAIYHIQDGQQRLMTYTLMCAALRDVFEKQNAGDTDARIQEAQKIVFYVSPTGMTSQRQVDEAELRINPSPKNKDNYQHIARRRKLDRNGKFERAWKILNREASRLSLDEAHEMLDYLTKRVIAVQIISGAENATEVFETLNDRGKHLDDVDLVRNYFYSHFGTDFDSRHEEVHANLLDLRDRFSGQKPMDKMAAYVRCHMQCRYGSISAKQMHKGIRTFVERDIQSLDTNRKKDYVHSLTLDLRRLEHVTAFLALYDGEVNAEVVSEFIEHSGSKQHRRNMQNFVGELQEYSVTWPILYAILTQFQGAEGAEKRQVARNGNQIARNLTSFLMRTTAVVDKFSPSTLQEAFSNWGKKIRDELTTGTAREFAASLKDIDRKRRNPIWENSDFKSSLLNLRVSNEKGRRILLSLYSYQQGDLIQQNADRLSVEHILPKSSEWLSPEGWPDFDEDSHTLQFNKLGNLTLLALANNRGGVEHNESFEKKAQVLRRSTLAENQEIVQSDRWTPSKVQERQNRLAGLACQVWPLNDR